LLGGRDFVTDAPIEERPFVDQFMIVVRNLVKSEVGKFVTYL